MWEEIVKWRDENNKIQWGVKRGSNFAYEKVRNLEDQAQSYLKDLPTHGYYHVDALWHSSLNFIPLERGLVQITCLTPCQVKLLSLLTTQYEMESDSKLDCLKILLENTEFKDLSLEK